MSNPLARAELRQFTGTERWYRHAINRKVLFTDGAKYVADQAGPCWLLDEIALIQPYEKHPRCGCSRSMPTAAPSSSARTVTTMWSFEKPPPTRTSRATASRSGTRVARSFFRASIDLEAPPDRRRGFSSSADHRLLHISVAGRNYAGYDVQVRCSQHPLSYPEERDYRDRSKLPDALKQPLAQVLALGA